MNIDILNIMSEPSLITLIIATLSFLLTLLLKIPFKKLSAKKSEEKRKALNSVIITFPLILSFILTSLYYGILCSVWISIENSKIAFNAWLSALTIYEIYKRLKMITKGLATNTETSNEIKKAKKEIKNLLGELKSDEKQLKNINGKITDLINKNITNNKSDLLPIFQNNIKLATLNEDKNNLENKINNIKNSLKEKL